MLNRVSVYAICIGILSIESAFSSESNDEGASVSALQASRSVHRPDAVTPDQKVQAYLEEARKHLVPTHREDPSEWVRLLSLDGGGLRGLIFLPQLWALEIFTGKRIHELFDIIGGTSTGGISAIGMSYMDASGQVMPLKDLIKVYLNCSREIFPDATTGTGYAGLLASGYQYNATGLERIIKTMVGEDKFCSSKFKTPVLITSVDDNYNTLKIFCSEVESDNHYIWKIARATSAAKTYLPCIEINDTVYVDGGHKANHPAKVFWSYYQEKLSDEFKGKHKLDNNKLSIYSFGTGNIESYCDSDSLKKRKVLGNVISTIQNQFSMQEQEVNKDLSREVILYRKAIVGEEAIIAESDKFKQVRNSLPANTENLKRINRQLNELELKLETLSKFFVFLSALSSEHNKGSEALVEAHQKLALAQLEEMNAKEAELNKEKKQVLDAMKGPSDDLKDTFIVQAYHRSQTEPLLKELHDMDNFRNAPLMFDMGMQMLYSDSFKNLLRSLFRPELNVLEQELDEVLNYIGLKIRTEMDLLEISDTKELTMLSIIDNCHNKFESCVMPDNYFASLLTQAGYNLDNLDMSQTDALLKWTQALYNENYHLWNLTGSKAHSVGDNVFAGLGARIGLIDPRKWESIHSSTHTQISRIKNQLLSNIVSRIKALDDSTDVEKFSPENIDEQINLATPAATWLAGSPNGSDEDKLFDKHIVTPLRLKEVIDGNQDNLPYQLILREIRFRLKMSPVSAGQESLINRIDSYLTMMNSQ